MEAYSPCRYGLYRSTVGPDTLDGDFFQNLPREPVPSVPPPSQALRPRQPAADPGRNAREAWPAIPAAGTAALTAAAAYSAAKRRKENF